MAVSHLARTETLAFLLGGEAEAAAWFIMLFICSLFCKPSSLASSSPSFLLILLLLLCSVNDNPNWSLPLLSLLSLSWSWSCELASGVGGKILLLLVSCWLGRSLSLPLPLISQRKLLGSSYIWIIIKTTTIFILSSFN